MTSEARRPTIERLLVDHADKRGWVDIEVRELEGLAGVPEHRLAHVLWDLQKRGLLTFRERKLGTSTMLTGLRITSQGRKVMEAIAREEEGAVIAVAVPEPTTWAGGKQPTVTLIDAVTGSTTEIEVEPRIAPPPTDGGWVEPLPVIPGAMYPLLKDLLRRDRAHDKLAQAAKLLEEAGQEDLALLTLEKTREFTVIEEEMVRFIRQVNRADLLDPDPWS
jgi:hypothetical protein